MTHYSRGKRENEGSKAGVHRGERTSNQTLVSPPTCSELPPHSRACSFQSVIYKFPIMHDEQFCGMLLKRAQHCLNFVGKPHIVLIGEKYHISGTLLNCFLEVPR